MLLGKYCGGYGNGNQSCAIAESCLEPEAIEYCYQCDRYHCEGYENIDE